MKCCSYSVLETQKTIMFNLMLPQQLVGGRRRAVTKTIASIGAAATAPARARYGASLWDVINETGIPTPPFE